MLSRYLWCVAANCVQKLVTCGHLFMQVWSIFMLYIGAANDPLLPFAFRQLMTALIAIAVFLKTREGETGCLILGSLRRRLIS